MTQTYRRPSMLRRALGRVGARNPEDVRFENMAEHVLAL